MRKTCYLIAAGLLAALTILPAQAQWHDDDRYDDRYEDSQDGYGYGHGYDNGYNYNSGSFRCESRDRRTTRCPTQGYRVQLIRQFSDMPCVRGRSWGQDRSGVWVTNGCRALFRFDDRGNWGWNDGWNNGWNGGGQYGGDFVRCESRDNRSRSCPMSTGRRGDIRLVRQLSSTPCIEGQNWGRSRSGVWVSGGCRAEFVVTRGRGYERPPGDFGNLRPPGDLGDGLPPGGRGPGQSRDDSPPPGVILEEQGGRNRGPRLADVPPPGPAPVDRPRPRPISVAQASAPTPPPVSRPGMFEPAPEPSRPAQEPRPQEEATRETP